MKFAKRHFEKKEKIKVKMQAKDKGLKVTEKNVKEKLKVTKPDRSNKRLKMAVLYFLATVIRGRSKIGYSIEPFIL